MTHTDSAGISIVESHAARWDTSVPWIIAELPTLRIGTVDGANPVERFTLIRGLTRLSDGRVVVLEGTTNQLRWFGPAGEHILTRGGRGAGPGEFNSATSLHALGGDSVVVQDAPRIKQVLFGPSGELVREEVLDVNRYSQFGPWLECLSFTLPDRSLVGCRPESGLQSAFIQRPGLQRTFSRFVRVPWQLNNEYPLGLYGGLEQWGFQTNDGTLRYVLHPHYSRTVVGAGGNPLRIVIALNPDYSIEIWHPEGRLERILRRTNARRRVGLVACSQTPTWF